MRVPALIRRPLARSAFVTGCALVLAVLAAPPASAAGSYTAKWNGVPVAMTNVPNVVVESLPDATRAGSVTGFQTDDPAFTCLNGGTIFLWTAPAEFPGKYVARNGTQGPQCAYGTWVFDNPLSYTAVWSGSTTHLNPIAPQAVETLADASYAGTVTNFQTTNAYFSCLAGATIDVYTAPTSFPGKYLVRSGTGGSACAFGTFTFTVPAAAARTYSPASLLWGTTRVGTVNGWTVVTVTSNGSAPLNVSAVTVGGSHPGDFAKSVDTCTGAAVPPGSVCTFKMRFEPTDSGYRSATVTVTSDGPAVSLTMNGQGTYILVSPDYVSHGSVSVGSSGTARTLTVTNYKNGPVAVSSVAVTGTMSGDFPKPTDTCTGVTLPAGGTCTFSVRFSPTVVGLRNATARTTSDGGIISITQVGTGLGLTVSPTAIDYGDVPTGNTVDRAVTVSNIGTGAVSVTSAAIGGANASEFTKASDGCSGTSVPAGGSCTVTARFVPASNGAKSATLTVVFAGGSTPVSLTGVAGTIDVGVSRASIDFGFQASGSPSAPQAVTVSNAGTLGVSVSGVTVGGTDPGDFAVSSNTCPATLAAGASCTVEVTFTPTADGARSALLSVATSGGTRTVTLSGVGDGAAPVSALTTRDGDVVLSTSAVSGTVTDVGLGVHSVLVTYANGVVSATSLATLACSADRLWCTWAAATPTVPGTYVVTVSSTDVVGNVESPGPAPITIVVV